MSEQEKWGARLLRSIEGLGVLPLLFLLVVIVFWRGFLFESLWLDETITYWVTDHSLWDTVLRSLKCQGQSPLYFMLIWGIRQVAGSSEWVLRTPSVLATGLSAVVLYSMARRRLDREISLCCVVLFLSSSPVLTAAMSARPYALALFFALSSLYFFQSWIESGNYGEFGVAFATAILAYYAHYLFGAVLVVHLSFLLQRPRRNVVLIVTATLLGLLCAWPGYAQMGLLAERRLSLSFAEVPGMRDLAGALFPPNLVLYIINALILAAIIRGKFVFAWDPFRRSWPYLLWYLLPPLVFFVHAILSETSLFVGRYFLWYVPAFCLLSGMLLQSIRSATHRQISCVVLCLLALFFEQGRRWQVEDWRSVPNRIGDSTSAEVLLYSGLVEDYRPESYDVFMEGYVFSPLSAYRGKQRLLRFVPTKLEDPASADYASRLIFHAVRFQDAAYLVCLKQPRKAADGTRFLSCDRLTQIAEMELQFKTEKLQDGLVQVFRLFKN